jgi:hypothetical protein
MDASGAVVVLGRCRSSGGSIYHELEPCIVVRLAAQRCPCGCKMRLCQVCREELVSSGEGKGGRGSNQEDEADGRQMDGWRSVKRYI